MGRLLRATTVLATFLAGTSGLLPAALGAPPANDDRASATIAPNIPFNDAISTVEATTARRRRSRLGRRTHRGRHPARYGFTFVECDGVAPWSLEVTAGNDLFVAGRADAEVFAASFDDDSFDFEARSVRLTGQRR